MAEGFSFVLFDSNSECGGKQKQKIRDEWFTIVAMDVIREFASRSN